MLLQTVIKVINFCFSEVHWRVQSRLLPDGVLGRFSKDALRALYMSLKNACMRTVRNYLKGTMDT